MIVNRRRTEQNVLIEDIEAGTVFEFNGTCYMKIILRPTIHPILPTIPVVNLSTGEVIFIGRGNVIRMIYSSAEINLNE